MPANKVHGHTSGPKSTNRTTPEYRSWRAMKNRCLNLIPGKEKYHGMHIHPEWVDSFSDFLRDMGPRPIGKTLDRVDNSKGYTPDNCRWATPTEQARNRDDNIFLGSSVEEEAKKAGFNADTIRRRIRNGVPMDKVFSPVGTMYWHDGSAQQGEKNKSAKLTDDNIREIRSSCEKSSVLAKRLGVTKENINMIKARKTWKHIND